MTGRDVVVTGLGALTALGPNFNTTIEALLAGRSGVRQVADGLLPAGGIFLAARVQLGEEDAGWSADTRMERSTHLGLIAAREAWRHAGLASGAFDPARAGIHVGIALGGADSVDRAVTAALADAGTVARPHPFTVIRAMPNGLSAWASIEFGLRGPSQTTCVGCASSALAIGEALRCIRHGYADLILVVGAEAMLFPTTTAAWDAMRVLAPPDPADPECSVRPFDRRRNGFALGEGAAALVLEEAGHARRRGAAALARVTGVGITTDAAHITRPQREGQVAAMRAALADAGVAAADVGYLNAHGTATPVGDPVEAQAIHEVFGAHAAQLPVGATKSMHGHLQGAGGSLEFAIALHALRTGALAPTAHLEDPDPKCPLDHVLGRARLGPRPRAVMSNSFAFGGTNVSLLACRED